MTPQSRKAVALEACPFCGGEGVFCRGGSSGWIRCLTCHCETTPEISDHLAIAAWNRRAAPRTPASTGEDTYTDEAGTVWSRPTAYAYAAACKALWKHRDAALPLSSGLQTADIAFTGPVDGMGDADPSGAYLLLHIDRKDGTQERLKVSRTAADGPLGDLAMIVEGPSHPSANTGRITLSDGSENCASVHIKTPRGMTAAEAVDWAARLRDALSDEIAASAQCPMHAGHSPMVSAASVVSPPSSGWEPIETAPRDGTVIDLWMVLSDGRGTRGHREADCRWDQAEDAPFGWMQTDWEGDSAYVEGIAVKATHWRPLPPPPSREGAGK